MWHLPHVREQQARDKQMEVELKGEVPMRSPNLYGDPTCVQQCYNYDAEAHADEEIAKYLNGGREVRDAMTTIVKETADDVANWFLPEDLQFKVRPRM